MMIRICYPDGRYDMIKASHLERLIDLDRIRGFKRDEGWAIVGRDPIRRWQERHYHGPERRKTQAEGH